MKTLLQTLKLSANLLVVSLVLCAAFALQTASANNIRIIGIPKISDQDTSENTVKISFDIAWDNSWKSTTPNNHDAAWIFVKCWDGEGWNHVYLMDDAGSYVAGDKDLVGGVSGKAVYKVTDRKGEVTDMDMELMPGYSQAWKEWKKLDPQEKAQKCVVGFFLYRKGLGSGDVVVPGVSFTWNYGEQTFADEDDLVVKVFAVEMVYVPEGGFYLGGVGTAAKQTGSFTTGDGSASPAFGKPYWLDKEDALTVNKSAGKLWAANNAITAGDIPKEYPKGYKAFYIMKYEMSQEAYCEFLNTLQQGQQDTRIEGRLENIQIGQETFEPYQRPKLYNDGNSRPIHCLRNYIVLKQAAPTAVFACDANWNSKYNETDVVVYRPGDTLVRNTDGQDIAMNLVSVRDLLAYAEFAGLRPMTELEYEKACRGGKQPAPDEYAWGSNTKVFFGQSYNWNSQDNWAGKNLNIQDQNTGTEAIKDVAYYASRTVKANGEEVSYPAGGYRAYNCGYTRYGAWWHWMMLGPAPLRVGIFADSTSTRIESGATFWGVMNMSDNVAEVCISTVDTLGRKFVGDHGCGQVDEFGEASNPNWAIPTANDSNSRRYYITRGMAFNASVSWEWSCGGCLWTDWNVTGWLNSANDAKGNAGMISSRHRWNQNDFGLANRDYMKRNYGQNQMISGNGNDVRAGVQYPCMIGIRCVRTADTVTYHRDK